MGRMEAVSLRLLRWRRPVWCQISVLSIALTAKKIVRIQVVLTAWEYS